MSYTVITYQLRKMNVHDFTKQNFFLKNLFVAHYTLKKLQKKFC